MVKLVLILLLAFSVFSWAVIFFKFRQFRSADRASVLFLKQFAGASRLRDVRAAAEQALETPLSVLVQEGLAKIEKHASRLPGSGMRSSMTPGQGTEFGVTSRDILPGVERTLKHTVQDEITYYENYLGFLATTGNVTPFIGLFGTVWGILNAFQQIGIQGSANIAAVAPGVAEALIATAAGLATAIPAVVAYNYFINRIRKLASQLEVFAGELLSFMESEIDQARKHGS
jgi:biopolymer transport protein TolQ